MNLLLFKFGNKKLKFKAPDSWSEVPFYKFVKFQQKLKPTEVYELFTGIESKEWEKPHHANLYANIDGQLAFLSEEPKLDEIPTHIHRIEEDKIGNKVNKNYKVKKDFLNVPLGKYRDLIEVTKQITDEANNTIEIMPKMIAIFGCDKYEDEEELEEIAKEIEKMPSDIIYTLGCFFLQKLNALSNGIQKKWVEVILTKMKTILRQVLTKLLMSLVISILFIISPLEILRSTNLSFKRKWLKFIGRNKYKVVSISQKHYTVD